MKREKADTSAPKMFVGGLVCDSKIRTEFTFDDSDWYGTGIVRATIKYPWPETLSCILQVGCSSLSNKIPASPMTKKECRLPLNPRT
ncbi:MAG: hypothetical protein KC502_17550 [Myxococcales bacterium]|nr:hypothetical protein [Myxococcales bacterium]